MAVVRQDTVRIDFDVEMKELTKMRDELDEIKKMLGGGLGDDALDEFMKDAKKSTEGIDDLKDSVNGIKPDGIEDTVKELKKTDDSAEDAHKELKKLGKTSFDKTISGLKKIGSTLGSIAVKAGKVLAKGIAVGAAGVAAVVGKSVSEYANYEQLVGGVETLFGTSSQSIDDYAASIGKSTAEIKAFQKANGLVVDGIIGPKTMAAIEQSYNAMSTASETVLKNANSAYKNAGLSANDYMETVTSFSASLINGLGGDTAKAANYADMAIVDMADNANKMGTDMSSIQDAYQGFAKQNYTMLDNLKLGYGGTKTEMERLLKDAEKLTGKKYDVSNFADITDAIHAIQVEMGISGLSAEEAAKAVASGAMTEEEALAAMGTTAKEASTTISGSFASMKAAAMNTLTALVLGGDDLDECINNLVDSAKTFGKNAIPAVTKALQGFGKLIEEVAPIIEKEIPTLIETLLPPLIKAATSLVKGIIVALPDIIKTLAKEIPGVLSELWGAFKEAFGDVPGFEKVENFFGKLKELFENNKDTIEKLVPVIAGLVGAFMLLKKLKFLGGLFGGKGGGGGIFSGFTNLANLKTGTVLKGMANLAIILGGLAGIAALLMWAAPYIAQLSDLQSMGELLLAIAAVGLLGSALAKLAGTVGNIPVSTVAKGLADIAIIMVGLGALAFVLGWASNLFDFDIAKMLKLLGIIGAVGLVGSALAGLAGLIGAIPVSVVLTGLGNIALALGGITAIIEAFGLLSEIPGFNDFLTKGGEVLAEICRIIGEMAGSLIGGIGEGITNSLPAIGENISAFAAALEPAMASFSSMNFKGLKNFSSAFGEFILVMTGEKILSWFSGGIDYAQIGTDLTALTTNGAGFFEAVQNIPEAAFTAATKLFECLNGIGSLPKSGGLKQWFAGKVDYQNIADGVASLGSETMVSALTAIKDLPESAFTNLSALFTALGSVKELPTEGGFFDLFTGDATTGLKNVISVLPEIAENLKSFYDTTSGIENFYKIGSLFTALAKVNDIAYIDANTTGLYTLSGWLVDIATNCVDFFTLINGINTAGLTAFITFFKDAGAIESTDGFGKVCEGIKSIASEGAGFFTQINGLNTGNMSAFVQMLQALCELPPTLATLGDTLKNALVGFADAVSTNFSSVQETATTTATVVAEQMGNAVSAVNDAVADMKAAMDFTWNLPKLKMPHINISGSFSLDPPKAPKFSVSWYKDGGILTKPTVFGATGNTLLAGGEAGAEAVVPLKTLWDKMETMISEYSGGYSPESDAGAVYNYGGNSEYSISPVFNLTISGSQDDNVLARKVKRYVSEAIKETFESLDRKVGVVREV